MTQAPGPGPLIGIDVGGTKIAAGLVDPLTGRARALRRQPTGADRPPDAIIADIAALLAELRAEAEAEGAPAAAAGVALPELVDRAGTVRSAWNFDIAALPDRLRRGAAAGLPLAIESDVRAAALAEARHGAGTGLASFAYVTLSTGISYTLCLDGRPWPGHSGLAIHFASTRLCLPGPDGGLVEAMPEIFAAGRGMAERWHRAGGDGDVRAMEAAAAAGNATARTILSEGARIAGALIAQMVDMLDPQAILLGGGLGLSDGLYARTLRTTIRAAIFAAPARDVPILRARLGPDAGLVGAALAAGAAATPADAAGA